MYIFIVYKKKASTLNFIHTGSDSYFTNQIYDMPFEPGSGMHACEG